MDLREVTEFFRDFMWYIIAFVVIAFVLIFVVSIQTVAGNSMDPTLKDGDRVLVSKISYKLSKVSRNDIVLVSVNGKSFVKRVIGLPGEKIEYMDGFLFVNDEPFKETYLAPDVLTYNFMFSDVCSIENCPDGKIPDNKYMVVGDNRPESIDSRDPSFGLVDKSSIKGKVVFRIWPFGSVR